MKNLLYSLVLFIAVGCGSDLNIPKDVTWEITEEKANEALSKDNITILLNKKVDESVLKEIALHIKESRPKYNKLWIFYHIPDMTEGMAWATTHFTPGLEVKILGSTSTQDENTAKAETIEGEILGKWRSEKSLMGAVLLLYRNPADELMMRITFKEGGLMESAVVESMKGGMRQYHDDNDHGEFYVVESNGNLGMYSAEGKFDEAVSID